METEFNESATLATSIAKNALKKIVALAFDHRILEVERIGLTSSGTCSVLYTYTRRISTRRFFFARFAKPLRNLPGLWRVCSLQRVAHGLEIAMHAIPARGVSSVAKRDITRTSRPYFAAARIIQQKKQLLESEMEECDECCYCCGSLSVGAEKYRGVTKNAECGKK